MLYAFDPRTLAILEKAAADAASVESEDGTASADADTPEVSDNIPDAPELVAQELMQCRGRLR